MAWWVSDAAMMQIEPWPLWMVQSLWICYQLHGNDRLYKGAKDVDKCLTETGERKQSFHCSSRLHLHNLKKVGKSNTKESKKLWKHHLSNKLKFMEHIYRSIFQVI